MKQEEPKQETLEEEAVMYAHKSFIWPLNNQGEKQSIPPCQTVPAGYTKHQKIASKHFIAGAKWQQQQNKNLYSDEDIQQLRQLFKDRFDCYADSDDVVMAVTEDTFIKIILEFQQFKKQ